MANNEYSNENQYLLYDEQLIDNRNNEIKKIANDVVEVNGLYQDINNLVVYQSDILNNIEYHVEQANVNIEKGVEQIIIAKQHQRCTRKCYCWIAIIVLVLCAIVVISIAMTIKR